MSFLGDIGQTIFGGSDSNQKSSSNSSNQSNSNSGNLAFPFLAAALGAPTGYTGAGGDLIASLLGIPGYADRPVGTPQPVPAPLPQTAPPPLPAPLTHVDLFHDGINGNGKRAAKNGQPTSYWVNQSGQMVNPNQQTASPLATALGLNRRRDPVPATPTVPPTIPGTTTTHIDDSGMGPAIKPSAAPATPTGATAGASALDNFANSAGLKFIQDENRKMIDNSQAAKGMLQSGATLKALQDRATSINSTFLNDYLSKLLDFSKLGLGAAGILGSAGSYSQGSSLGSGVSSSQGSSSSKPGLIPGLRSSGAGAGAAEGG